MKRGARIRLAALSACVIAFAQIAVAAQPWPVDLAAHRHVPATAAIAVEAAEPCTGHLAGGNAGAPQPECPASPNVCEVHCQDATQPDATVVAAAAPAFDAWLAVRLVEDGASPAFPDDALRPRCASPPVRLLFARFLI